jgi:site-specific DNA recombinase
VAEHARREASYRTRRGQEGRALAGKTAGGRAFGYIPAALSGTGEVEIEKAQALVVRRIFELYADGVSPRNIAARFNAEGIPSPGAQWRRRTVRRTDGKWLASAIHGDVRRGTGILNNRRYIGVVTWGRTEWRRSAADSSVRRVKVLEHARVERTDERLRIVSNESWQRVKARQARTNSAAPAMTVRGTVRKGGGGKPGKYLFTGLLACEVCGASFVLRNRESTHAPRTGTAARAPTRSTYRGASFRTSCWRAFARICRTQR